MMIEPKIKASGVLSVASNIAPGAVQRMTEHLNKGEIEEGKKLAEALQPLFGIITVKTSEETPYGEVLCKARNPLATKTLMNILGMPSGALRPPMGKMTKKGIQVVLEAGRAVHKNNPEILEPIESCFGVNVEERLNDDRFCDGLYYEKY